MKNTIRNTVEEVYNTNVNNIKANPSVSASQFVKVVPSVKNVDIRKLKTNSMREHNGSNSFLLILLGMLFVAFVGIAFYFRDKIKQHLDKIFDSPPKKSNKVVEQKKPETHIKKEKEGEKDEKDEKGEKENKPPIKKKPENVNKANYSDNQIVKQDDMYCYVGEDDNMRQCIEVFKDDVCTSGDIFNRIDECLVPKKKQL